MPTMISGARDNTNIQAARLVVDMGDLHQLEDDKNKLFVFVKSLAKKGAHSQTIKWLTDELTPKNDQVNDASNMVDSDTAMVVDNGGYFRINDRVKVIRTGEVVLVTAISTNTLTITRSVGGTAAAGINDNDWLLIMAPGYAQGATLEAARTVQEAVSTNYMQIFRDPYSVTGTHAAEASRGGHEVESDVKTQRMKKALEHARGINHTAYFGEAALASGTGSAGGIREQIPTGNVDATATLTEEALNTALRTMFRYGSSTKVLFCSRQVAGIIDGLFRDRQRITPGAKKHGIQTTEYQSSHGVIRIVTDHAIEKDAYDKHAFLVDPDGPRYRSLRDTKLLVGRQANDADSVVEEYLTECSFEWGNGNNHGVFTSVAA